MFAFDSWWWFYAHRAAQRHGLGRGWKIALAVTMSIALAGLALLLIARILQMQAMVMPERLVVLVYIWHLLILPLIALPSLAAYLGAKLVRLVRSQPIEPARMKTDGALDPSRRAFLAQALVVVPPVATLALAGKSAWEQDHFRINRIQVPLAALPAELEGMTIAFVSDPHVGSFMTNEKFNRIITATNELDADLVLHGGDLINSSLKDLPDGIELLRGMRGRYGVYSCQGNHDRIMSAAIFERDTRRAGVGMLLDEAPTLRIKGRDVQILSPRWRGRSESQVAAAVNDLLPLRNSNAFSILLAHHPHSFDAAVAASLPLTVAGHSHGGQLGLTRDIGIGRVMYRYWSGLYQRGGSACVVSNGVGNWFPVRLNVPCEIVHLTLRRA